MSLVAQKRLHAYSASNPFLCAIASTTSQCAVLPTTPAIVKSLTTARRLALTRAYMLVSSPDLQLICFGYRFVCARVFCVPFFGWLRRLQLRFIRFFFLSLGFTCAWISLASVCARAWKWIWRVKQENKKLMPAFVPKVAHVESNIGGPNTNSFVTSKIELKRHTSNKSSKSVSRSPPQNNSSVYWIVRARVARDKYRKKRLDSKYSPRSVAVCSHKHSIVLDTATHTRAQTSRQISWVRPYARTQIQNDRTKTQKKKSTKNKINSKLYTHVRQFTRSPFATISI